MDSWNDYSMVNSHAFFRKWSLKSRYIACFSICSRDAYLFYQDWLSKRCLSKGYLFKNIIKSFCSTDCNGDTKGEGRSWWIYKDIRWPIEKLWSNEKKELFTFLYMMQDIYIIRFCSFFIIYRFHYIFISFW